MAQALVRPQVLRSSGLTHRARVPARSASMGQRRVKPVQAAVAFVETEVATEQSTRVASRQRVQEVQTVIAMKIKEAAAEAPARRLQRDRVLLAACIKAAALQHILATNIM